MRKSKIPTPLQKLSETELGEVHSWFKRCSYDEILVQLQDRFGISMSRSQIARYYKRFAEAQLFNAVLHTPLTPADMLAIKNADPIPDHINRDELKKHCLRLAQRPGLRASDLKHLFDVFTYDDRQKMTARSQLLQIQELDLREQFQEYRRQLHARRSDGAADV